MSSPKGKEDYKEIIEKPMIGLFDLLLNFNIKLTFEQFIKISSRIKVLNF